MALKLDNNQDYPLTQAEQIWWSKEMFKMNIEDLKELEKPHRTNTLLAYTSFVLASYLAGNNIAKYINNQNDDYLIWIIASIPFTFITNYYGINSIKEYYKYADLKRRAKSALKAYNRLEKISEYFEEPVSDKTINNFIETARSLNDLVKEEKRYIKK